MELLQQLTSQLGVSNEQAKGGAGLIFDLVKSQLGGDDFAKVTAAVPEAGELAASAPGKSGVASVVGGLMSSLGGGGSSLGSLASLADGFSKLNMDGDMVSKFLPIIMSFVQAKGGDTIKQLIARVVK